MLICWNALTVFRALSRGVVVRRPVSAEYMAAAMLAGARHGAYITALDAERGGYAVNSPRAFSVAWSCSGLKVGHGQYDATALMLVGYIPRETARVDRALALDVPAILRAWQARVDAARESVDGARVLATHGWAARALLHSHGDARDYASAVMQGRFPAREWGATRHAIATLGLDSW